MPKNEAKSHSDWGRGGDDPQEVLGEEILFRKNPYKGARKLGAGSRLGSGFDEDFWMALVQTSYHPHNALAWEHKGVGRFIRKAARIPYLVKDHEKQLALDHLLIGYIEPAGAATALAKDWGDKSPDNDMGRLGRLIMVDLFPGLPVFGEAWPFVTWPNGVFDEDPVVYTPGVARTPWVFRNVPCRVEKSMLVKYAAKAGGQTFEGGVLVGYEGSGGW